MTIPKDALYKYKAIMLIRYLAKNYIINYFHDERENVKSIVF